MLSSGSGDGGFLAEDPLHTSVLAGWFHPTVSSKTQEIAVAGRREGYILVLAQKYMTPVADSRKGLATRPRRQKLKLES